MDKKGKSSAFFTDLVVDMDIDRMYCVCIANET